MAARAENMKPFKASLLSTELSRWQKQINLISNDSLAFIWERHIADSLQLRRHIGIVFQEFRLLEHLTTFENVALPLRVLGQPESQYRENVTELLEWVGLGERAYFFTPPPAPGWGGVGGGGSISALL